MTRNKAHCPLTDPQTPCIYEPGRCTKCRIERFQIWALNLRWGLVGLRPLPGSLLCTHYENANGDRDKRREAWQLWQQASDAKAWLECRGIDPQQLTKKE